ncbi:hypothetical protein EA004_19495 [Vibrio anguillarum]|nr:hypothetical protein [Vibrio anguillarum]
MQNCSSAFTVCFLSSAVRCQPLSRALNVYQYHCNKISSESLCDEILFNIFFSFSVRLWNNSYELSS